MKLTDYASADALTLALSSAGWRKVSSRDCRIGVADFFSWSEHECPMCGHLNSYLGLCPAKSMGHADLSLLIDIRENGSIGKCWRTESYGGTVHRFDPGDLGITPADVGAMLLAWENEFSAGGQEQ